MTPEETEEAKKIEADVKEAEKKKAAAEKDKAAQAAASKPEDLITRANAAAMRIEAANEEQKNLLDRQQAQAVETKLGGTAEAGTPKKEETPGEYSKRVMANDVEQTPPAA